VSIDFDPQIVVNIPEGAVQVHNRFDLPAAPVPVINVAAPNVTVTLPEQAGPVIHLDVPAPVVYSEPVVNVTVPEAPPPIVNVSLPEQPLSVHVALPAAPEPIWPDTAPQNIAINLPEQAAPVVNVLMPDPPALPAINVAVQMPEQAFRECDMPAVINVLVPPTEPPVVNVAAPIVTVNLPETQVVVQAPVYVDLPAPVVNVEPAQVHVAVAAPVVNVEANVPEIIVPPATVIVSPTQPVDKKVTVQRDGSGRISSLDVQEL
jgi:hypothetical protein